MRTTISQEGDRRGVACDGRTFDEIVADARRIFADVAALIDLRLEVLAKLETGAKEAEDDAELKRVRDLMKEARDAWRTVLDIESRLGTRGSGAVLDLEAAREEIESRLDRLFAAEAEAEAARRAVRGDAGGDALSLGSVGASGTSGGP